MVAFDFEISPKEKYRAEERAALDAHKADITGVSFSVSEGSGIYVPLRHRIGRSIAKLEAVMEYLRQAVFENTAVVKVAHNLAFESMFLYAIDTVVQPPCYDTIAAAQLTLKSYTLFRGLSDSGLKTLVPQLFKVELPDFMTVTGGRFFDELNPQDGETVRYACADSDYALRLYHLFNGDVYKRQGRNRSPAGGSLSDRCRHTRNGLAAAMACRKTASCRCQNRRSPGYFCSWRTSAALGGSPS